MSTATEPVDGRRARGARTRRAILGAAVDIASREGLEALTIGRLAGELGMSKSGLFASFGSKQELQIATIDAAREIYVRTIGEPVADVEPGLSALRAICEAWSDYLAAETFPGGCFYAQASAEFDARPGPVRDRIAAHMTEWLDVLEGAASEARRRGELPKSTDPPQLAFELNGLMLGGNWAFQLYRDREALERTRRALRDRVAQAAAAA